MVEEIKSENKIKSKFYEASLLIFLYFLQGLICGILLDTMQMNLKLNFSYKEIGIFLMCSYPFSLKIFWSPIVDTYYLKSLGLRKTWIIFTQSISALILIYLGYTLDDMLIEKKIYTLSIVCFLLMFCIATQDIAVDGWALSLCGNDVS
jgi:PAT family acetyl-CoA transporter-like MFS transporter 1